MDGETIQCFIPNPGRMRELLYPDAKVCLLEKASGNRRTSYDLVLVKLGTTLVSIDSRVPNKIVEEAINAEALPEFRGLRIERSEPVFRESRLDFLLAWEPGRMFLEVKPCTLVEGRTALFPDAPTTRGTRHIQALISALKTCRSALFFLVQRSDTDLFSPNDETDHKFSMALREAVQRGVEVYAYNSKVSFEGISAGRQIPVKLSRNKPRINRSRLLTEKCKFYTLMIIRINSILLNNWIFSYRRRG